jgi:Asp-tRNA(Asn)/Glu-tRNA(Gln) amidotransferase A subunit family amidase
MYNVSNPLFYQKSINDIHQDIMRGALSATEVALACIENVKEFDSRYFAFECFDENVLLHQTKAIDEIFKAEKTLRPLEAIPVGVKDIFNTKEFKTQMGSPLWKDFTPGNDARVVHYLREAGAIIPGKTVTAEFAVHTLNQTLNPYDIKRTPGTSSSGSAVAVALGMVPAALGTQTAGSIVRPASFCGVYGCKPSFGLLPRTGMLKTTDSLDTLGFFVSRMEDLRILFDTVRVHGCNFPFSNKALNDKHRQNKPDSRPWKIAFVKTHTWADASDYAKASLLSFVSKLATNKNIEICEMELPPEMEQSHAVHATIYNKTLSYYFRNEFANADLVSKIMKELIEEGIQTSVKEYHGALEKQTNLCHTMDSFLSDFDAIISLSTAGEAPEREILENRDPALIWTLTHLPVVSIPLFKSPKGLPFGMQICARKYNDYLLFNLLDYLASEALIPRGCEYMHGKL